MRRRGVPERVGVDRRSVHCPPAFRSAGLRGDRHPSARRGPRRSDLLRPTGETRASRRARAVPRLLQGLSERGTVLPLPVLRGIDRLGQLLAARRVARRVERMGLLSDSGPERRRSDRSVLGHSGRCPDGLLGGTRQVPHGKRGPVGPVHRRGPLGSGFEPGDQLLVRPERRLPALDRIALQR
jgi:hypothetical protein